MADSHVTLTAGSGTNVDSTTVTTGDGTNQRQRISVGDAASNNNWAIDSHSSGQVKLYDTSGNALVTAAGDGQSATGLLNAGELEYNGSTWDRKRNANQAITIFASAARTASAFTTMINYDWNGGLFILNVTANSSGSITFQILDTFGNTQILFIAATAITATGTYSYLIAPGISTSNLTGENITLIDNKCLPGLCNPFCVANNANSMTYSLTFYPAKAA